MHFFFLTENMMVLISYRLCAFFYPVTCDSSIVENAIFYSDRYQIAYNQKVSATGEY